MVLYEFNTITDGNPQNKHWAEFIVIETEINKSINQLN